MATIGTERRPQAPILPWRPLFGSGVANGRDDAELLALYLEGRDIAEAAFEAILRRHGPMVLGICRRELRDPHAIEDAFQATFLVLARRAGAIRDGDRIGSWLGRVARRVARKARARAARLRRLEDSPAPIHPGDRPEFDFERDEIREAVRAEVGRLPARLRAAIVLCDLEGLPRAEAARRLGWPIGTLHSRLSRARGRLHAGLERRGLGSPAIIAPALLHKTMRAALPGGKASVAVVSLAKSTLLGLAITRGLMVAGAGLSALVVAAGMALLIATTPGHAEARPAGPPTFSYGDPAAGAASLPSKPTPADDDDKPVAVAARSHDPETAEREEIHAHGRTWGLSFDAARERARLGNRNEPILAYFTGVNCANCRLMEKTVLTDPRVVPLLDDFVRVELFTDFVPIDSLTGAEREQLAERNLELEAELTQDTTSPVFAVLRSDGSLLAKLSGYRSPEEFARFLRNAQEQAKAPAARAEWGRLRGKVTFEGDPPPPATIDPKRDRLRDGEILALRDGPIYQGTRILVDPATQGVRDALVFLVDPTAIHPGAFEAARKPVPFQFDRGLFTPRILPVMAGTEVAVFTTDPIACNTRLSMPRTEFTLRSADRPEPWTARDQFNLLLRAESSFTVVPRFAGQAARRVPSELADDIHPWNRAYWQVLDHPYFAVTDARGEFEIANIPAGAQRLVVWHERTGWATPKDGSPLDVDPARPAEFRLSIRPDQLRP